MKLFYCYKGFYDGDHEHGHYMSPMFTNREAAEDYKNFLINQRTKEKKDAWWSDSGWWSEDEWNRGEDIRIYELETQDSFDENKLEGTLSPDITYT